MKRYIQFTDESIRRLEKDGFLFSWGHQARIDYINFTSCSLSQFRKACYLLAKDNEILSAQIKSNNFTGMLLLGFLEISEAEFFIFSYEESKNYEN